MVLLVTEQAVEEGPSAALRSSFVTAADEESASFLWISRALHLGLFDRPA